MLSVNLLSCDREIFAVDLPIVKCSNTIKTIVENMTPHELEREVLFLPKINSEILETILEWATYHVDDPQIVEDVEEMEDINADDISSWDIEFFNGKNGILNTLMEAAIDLDIKGLQLVICKISINLTKGNQAPEEIVEMFNLPYAFKGLEENLGSRTL